VPYLKKDAEVELERRFCWQRFQYKRHESRFIRFYGDYWLPLRRVEQAFILLFAFRSSRTDTVAWRQSLKIIK
jgi:hypothetical protein